jgi:hypothetical protein
LKTKAAAATPAKVALDTGLTGTNPAEVDKFVAEMVLITSLISGKTAADVRKVWDDYTKARDTCVTYALKIWGDTMCLACDADTADAGGTPPAGVTATAGTPVTIAVQLETAACAALVTQCYAYVAATNNLAHILDAYVIADKLTDINAFLDKVAVGAAGGAADADWNTLETALTTAQTTLFNAVNKHPARTPAGCTSNIACNWLCSELFDTTTGTIDFTLLVAGGVVQDNLLLADAGGPYASPAANMYAPVGTDAALTVDFDDNPADITIPYKGASFLKLGMMTVFALFMSLFM